MKKIQRFVQRSPLAAAVALGLFAAPMAQAFEFEKGELKGSLDTTVSYGISIRTEDPAEGLIGKATINPLIALQGQTLPGPLAGLGAFPGSAAQIAAPGRFSGNRDDGNIKYEKGDAFSNAFKITSELELTYRDWGFFTRASYFYDFENSDRDDFTQAAKEKVASDFRLYDAFIWKNYALGANDEVSGTVRFGNQVISWGESTFIQNGINVVNPVDVSRLRVAGAEVKEAFLPTNMLFASAKFSESVSMEAYYQFDWKPTEIDPSGTYFSTNDFASPGGTYIMLGFGTVTQPVNNPENFASTCILGKPAAGQTNVGQSDRFAELSAIYGASTATSLLAAACGAAGARLADNEARDSGQFGLALRWYAEALNQTEFGFYAMNYHSRLPLLSGRAANVILPAPAANSAALIVEYPEDIHLFGVSFNTTLPGGVAWQGEVSYRPNMPLQVDDVEVLFAGLSPINQALTASGAPKAAFFCSQLLPGCTSVAPGAYVKGWREHEVTQLQMTFTKAFSSVLGAEQIALVGELGGTQVNLPEKSVLRYEGEGTDTAGGCDVGDVMAGLPGSVLQPGCLRNPLTLVDGFPTNFSWGYRLAARADYNSVFGTPITLSPRLAFNHDVKGITPGPGGNFLEGRKSITVGVEANYLQQWVFDLSYTGFNGAGQLNQIYDRDFYSFSVKYSF
ncbi:DUF1302 domain-containing protein [Arenimonas sp.]|jgi:hypothetical protein|uniref:DUF1302 domain-containing protein n=1 Tax=Arenimonas sp. TaxID=1872635 RepID=UPI0037C05F31